MEDVHLLLCPSLSVPNLRALRAGLLSVLKAAIRTEDANPSARPDSLTCGPSLWIALQLLLLSSSCHHLRSVLVLVLLSCTDGGQLLRTRPRCCVTSSERGNDDLALHVFLSLSRSSSPPPAVSAFPHHFCAPPSSASSEQPLALCFSLSLGLIFLLFSLHPCSYCSSSLSRAVTTPPAEPPRLFIANRGWRRG